MATISRDGARQTSNRLLQILVVLSASGLLTLSWIGHRSVKLNFYGLHAVEEHGTGRNERSTRDPSSCPRRQVWRLRRKA